MPTTFSRKQKQVIPSKSINNDLAKTTTSKPLCFQVMPLNSISNDLVKTRKRSVFNCKRCHRSIPSKHVLVASTRSSFIFKRCHQILLPMASRSNKCKNICFSFYLIILHPMLILNNN